MVSGERLRILLLEEQPVFSETVLEVRLLRAQAHSVAACSLTSYMRWSKARGEIVRGASKSSVSGEVHGNFAACL